MGVAVKGTVFEIQVSKVISDLGSVLSNLTFYSEYLKRETEIDRLLVTSWGIYSIEAKSFHTEIIGGFEDEEWYGYSGSFITNIYNPVYQNFEHIRSLNNCLRRKGFKTLEIENIIVVPDSCKINTDYENVVNLSELRDFVLHNFYNRGKINVDEVVLNIKEATGGV